MGDPKAKGAKYAEQYKDWDYWLYQNARDTNSEAFNQLYSEGQTNGWIWMYAGVDKQGNLVPYMLSYDAQLATRYGTASAPSDSACSFSIVAGGPMDAGLLKRFVAARSALRAKYAPPVPQWLAKAPPWYAILLPDGRVVALGEMGTGKDHAELSLYGRPQAKDKAWCLYAADGTQQAQGEPGGEWWHLTFPNYKEALGLDKGGKQCWEYNGVISVYSADSYSLGGNYTFDGKPLSDASAPSFYATYASRLEGFEGAELPYIYRAQQQLKR